MKTIKIKIILLFISLLNNNTFVYASYKINTNNNVMGSTDLTLRNKTFDQRFENKNDFYHSTPIILHKSNYQFSEKINLYQLLLIARTIAIQDKKDKRIRDPKEVTLEVIEKFHTKIDITLLDEQFLTKLDNEYLQQIR